MLSRRSGSDSKDCDQLEALERMNEEFLLRDWGDGYPLLPPTAEAVERTAQGNLPSAEIMCCATCRPDGDWPRSRR